MMKKFKTQNEYCHINEDRIIITKTPEIGDLIEDYGKSINNVFKTLMVFFVFIPLFSVLAAIFYNMNKIGMAINAGAYGLFFLAIAFYTMLFTSGSPSIKRESIYKVKIQKTLFFNTITIQFKEFGRLKKRQLIIEKKNINKIYDLLLTENLIEQRDIVLNRSKIDILAYAIAFFIIAPSYLLIWNNTNNDIQSMMIRYGVLIISISTVLIVWMIRTLIVSIYRKITNR